MGKRLLSFLVICLCAVSMAFAQQKITGKVIDNETGEPVVGASVIVNGANGLGAATDINGNFTIQNVPNSAKTVRVSYIGMRTADFAIKSNMKINLMSEATGLNDVMVVAYGTQTVNGKTVDIQSNMVKARYNYKAGTWTGTIDKPRGTQN